MPYKADLSTFPNSSLLTFDSDPAKTIHALKYDCLAFIAVAQSLHVDFLPITWQAALGDAGLGGTAEIRQSLIRLQANFAFKRIKKLQRRRLAPDVIFKILTTEMRVYGHPILRNHPNIGKLLGICWDVAPDGDDVAYPVLVFEKAENGNLKDFARSEAGRTLGDTEKLKLCADICYAVMSLHAEQVIHGDIKPENVLVYRNDAGHYSARVIDFGYSVSYRTTRVANLCSTIGWTAPEWHHRGIIFQEARKMDIYSAGLVCLWLLCFVDEAQVPSNVRNDPSKFLETSSRISLPVDLQLFFTSCLSPDPDDRSIRMEVLMQKSLNLTSFPEVQHLVASPEQEALDEEFSLATSIGQLCSGDYRLRIMLVKMLSTAANDLSLFTKLRNNARFQLALCLALGFGTPKDLHASRSSLADSTFNEKIFAAEIDSIKLSNRGYKSRKIKELDTEGFLGDLQFQDYYRQIGLLPRAELECNREAADMASLLGVDHHLVKSLRRMNTTSCSKEVKFLQLPYWVEMERAARTAMETNIRMLGVNHLTTLRSISSLASICNLLSRDAEAEAFQLQVLERGKRHIGLYHPIVLASMTFLVQKYQDSERERWDDAEELQAYLVAAAEKEHGSQHPCTLDRMEDMVEIYQKQKSWKRAESLQIRVFNQRLAEFGPDHASTLRALLRLSIIFSNFGKSQDAERMLVQVIVRMKGSLGNEHADMLAALASLSILYATQGRTDEANRLGVYVYKQRIRILGVNHPDTQHWKQELPLLYINSNRPEEEDVITDLFDKIEERMTAHLPILGVRMRNLIYQRLNSAGLIEGDGDPAQEAECAAARKILLEFPDLFTATRDCEQFTRSQRLRMKNDPDGYFYSEWKAATEEEIHLSQVESVEERLRMSLHSRHPPVHMSLQMRSDYAQAPVSYNSSWDKENSQLETSRIPEINDNEDIEAVLGNKVDFDKKKMLPLTEISDECEIPNSSSKKEDQFGRYIKDLYSHSRVEADQASFRFTSHGPDVKFWEPGWRELHIAVLGDDTASVQRLLESGLAVNMEEIDEHDLRLDTGNEIVIEPLEVNSAFARLEYKNKKPPKKEKSALLRAAERGNVAIVKVLLNHGGNIKARSSSLHTALHYAAKMGNQALVQLLLGEGAPIEARDSLQQTPLHMAAAAGHQTVVQTLLDSGAKATVKDYYQQTPLFLAATSGHKEIVEIMIQQGVDIMAREIHYHQTALQQATRLGHKDIVALLLRHGATYSNENQADQWLPLRVVDLSV